MADNSYIDEEDIVVTNIEEQKMAQKLDFAIKQLKAYKQELSKEAEAIQGELENVEKEIKDLKENVAVKERDFSGPTYTRFKEVKQEEEGEDKDRGFGEKEVLKTEIFKQFCEAVQKTTEKID